MEKLLLLLAAMLPVSAFAQQNQTQDSLLAVIIIVLWVAVRILIIVGFYYLAKGIRKLYKPPIQNWLAVILTILLVIPGAFCILTLALLPSSFNLHPNLSILALIIGAMFFLKYFIKIYKILTKENIVAEQKSLEHGTL